MKLARIFNIQRFSLHDGDGIRTTVFFKGCPLSCLWCHNPESIQYGRDLLCDSNKCTLCKECISLCPSGAISLKENSVVVDANCAMCGKCVVYCASQARELVGYDISLQELLLEVKKDIVFYQESSGGVTLSGGEPMLQIDFIEALVAELKRAGISVFIDTSGDVPFEYFERIAPNVDTFLYDIKHLSNDLHKKYTGRENLQIIDNLIALSKIHNSIHIRVPLIEGVNSDDENIDSLLNLLTKTSIKKVSLLPYHNISQHKYRKLNRAYREEEFNIPSDEKLIKISEILSRSGFEVKIGG